MFDKLIVPILVVAAVLTFGRALYLSNVIDVEAQPLQRHTNAAADDMATTLQLSDAKASALQNILDAQHSAMQALDESLRPQRRAIMDVSIQKAAKLLDENQFQRFQLWQEAHRPLPPANGRPAAPTYPAQ